MSSLQPLGRSAFVTRGRFETQHDAHRWTVDVDYFDFHEVVRLYRDGVEVGEQRSPASFRLTQQATINATIGLLGMRKTELMVDGSQIPLTPAAGTAEARRTQLERVHPTVSRSISVLAWMVLAIALVVEVPQLIALLASGFGVEQVPTAPAAVNTIVGLAALAAALERALRFQSRHPGLL